MYISADNMPTTDVWHNHHNMAARGTNPGKIRNPFLLGCHFCMYFSILRSGWYRICHVGITGGWSQWHRLMEEGRNRAITECHTSLMRSIDPGIPVTSSHSQSNAACNLYKCHVYSYVIKADISHGYHQMKHSLDFIQAPLLLSINLITPS